MVYTSLDIYRELDDEFHFTTDPFAEPTNRLGCKVFFTKVTDGLKNVDSWQGEVFINPRYSREPAVTTAWIKTASE